MTLFLGKKALLSVGADNELKVEVWITDVKERWGVVRYQVRPVAGFGRKWVEQLTILKDQSST